MPLRAHVLCGRDPHVNLTCPGRPAFFLTFSSFATTPSTTPSLHPYHRRPQFIESTIDATSNTRLRLLSLTRTTSILPRLPCLPRLQHCDCLFSNNTGQRA